MKITITPEDIFNGRSPIVTGTLIDELAYSAREITSEDLLESESGHYALEYVLEHYDFERALLDETRTYQAYSALAAALNVAEAVNANIKEKHVGAFIALQYPDHWHTLLNEYTQRTKDEAYDYDRSYFLDKYGRELVEELEKATASAEKNDYKEWLYGNSGNYAGVLALIGKYYGTDEPIDYDEKADIAIFSFDDETIEDKCTYWEAEKPLTVEHVHHWLVNEIRTSADAYREKCMAESAKRRAERERVAAYKAERKAQEDAARRAKLEALNS